LPAEGLAKKHRNPGKITGFSPTTGVGRRRAANRGTGSWHPTIPPNWFRVIRAGARASHQAAAALRLVWGARHPGGNELRQSRALRV